MSDTAGLLSGEASANAGHADTGGQGDAQLTNGNGAGAGANGGGEGLSGTPNGQANDVDPNGHGNAWWHSFADGLDKSEAMTWRNFASRYTSPQEFAKAHIEMRKTYDTRIPVPGPDAKPEDWQKVYDRLGRPKEPSEYKFSDPEDFELDDTDKSYRDAMSQAFHRVGLNQWQVSELEKAQYEQIKLFRDSQKAARERAVEQAQKTLKAEWAADYDRNLKLANTSLVTYGKDDAPNLAALTLADGSTLGAHPAFIKMMARIGAERAEDDREPTPFNASARESAQAEIKRIEEEALARGLDPLHPDWPRDQLRPLYQKVAGSRNLGADPYAVR